jgi:FkbM family methyltransferase
MLRTNVSSNGFGSIVECIDKVCADKDGEQIEFFIDPEGSMVDSAVARPGVNNAAVTRRTITVDSLVAELNLKPSVIKIDVEGFEDLVLKGAVETLKQYRPTLFIEFHPAELALRGIATEEVLVMLEGLGFSCDELSDNEQAAIRPGHLFRFSNTVSVSGLKGGFPTQR